MGTWLEGSAKNGQHTVSNMLLDLGSGGARVDEDAPCFFAHCGCGVHALRGVHAVFTTMRQKSKNCLNLGVVCQHTNKQAGAWALLNHLSLTITFVGSAVTAFTVTFPANNAAVKTAAIFLKFLIYLFFPLLFPSPCTVIGFTHNHEAYS